MIAVTDGLPFVTVCFNIKVSVQDLWNYLLTEQIRCYLMYCLILTVHQAFIVVYAGLIVD